MYSDLRKLREDKGLTVEQLAEQSGIPAEKIREIESGFFPEMDAFLKFAHENDITPGKLLEYQAKQEKIRNTRRWKVIGKL